jgi:hypothetical protein
MPFATRVFCRAPDAPTLSELLVWQRQHETPVVVVGGASASELLAPAWTEAQLSYDEDEEPFTVRCLHAGDAGGGAARLREEVADFLDDLGELPPGEAVDRVRAQVAATQMLLVVEFPAAGVSARGYETNGWLMSLFVERAAGMVQCDGIGFYDEDDEIILRLG